MRAKNEKLLKYNNAVFKIFIMKVCFHRGFITYDFGKKSLLFVDVHPTTDLSFTPRDDIGADLLCVQLAKNLKCKTIITTMPRNQEFGMDFNRLPPSEREATKIFEKFVNNIIGDVGKYEKKYAWVAANRADHRRRCRIYEEFWSTVKRLSKSVDIVVFIHVQDCELRNFPSALDLVPISGFSKNKIKKVVAKINKKYKDEFEKLKSDFIAYAVSYHRNQYKTILLQMFNSTNPKRFSGVEKENYEKMLKRVLALGFKKEYKELKNFYSISRHVKIVRKIYKRIPLKATYMLNFSGRFALGTKKAMKELKMKNLKVLEVEVNSFLSEVRTDLAIKILEDLVELLRA